VLRYKELLWNVVFPILIGFGIYLLMRPYNLRFFSWLENTGIMWLIEWLRANVGEWLYLVLPEWVVYSLPNGLWSYGFMFTVVYIWRESKSGVRWFFVLAVVILSYGYELGQYIGVIAGTFCIVDLLFYSLGLIGGYVRGK